MADPIHAVAEQALELMRRRGFDGAQVGASRILHSEVNVAHNEASLLRSNETYKLELVGLLDGRRAAAEGSDLSAEALQAAVDELWTGVASAPQDEANAVSAGQQARLVQGPLEAELDQLAGSMSELLGWRARETPTMMIEEGLASHTRMSSRTLTSGGSDLGVELGCYEWVVFGLAREDGHSSSFNYRGGSAHSLDDALPRFGADQMMRELTRQVHTEPVGERFVGEVVLTPSAVADLVDWLLAQLRDAPLIDGSSLYRNQVGQVVAAPLLTLSSRFDGPGCAPVTADAFVAPPVRVLDAGRLASLTPSLYGSRKTGLPHVPVASGWDLAAGKTALAELIGGVARGALVDRLSMGSPAPNGDFSGVIKNSFALRDGQPGAALSETMISGNVAQMLRDVQAVSRERIDTGGQVLPWLRIGGLHFS